MVSARAPTTMISAALACCSMYGTGNARAERHSTDVARFSTAARNSASSSDNRFWMAAASSIEQLLRKIAFGEIHWRPEVRGGHADNARPESFGKISGYPEAGIVGPVQRQTDHDSFVVHYLLHALGAKCRMGFLPTKLHPRDPLRIETDLDQEPSVRADAASATLATSQQFARISFYFNAVDASNNFVAPPFTGSIGCDIWRAGRLSKAKHD